MIREKSDSIIRQCCNVIISRIPTHTNKYETVEHSGEILKLEVKQEIHINSNGVRVF